MKSITELILFLIKEYGLKTMFSIVITIFIIHTIPHWINKNAEAVMLFFLCLGIMIIIERIYWKNKKHNDELKNIEKKFNELTPPEIEILYEYIRQNTSSLSLDYMSGVVTGLADKHFIYRSTTMSYGTRFDYNIQPWAQKYLNKTVTNQLRRPQTREE